MVPQISNTDWFFMKQKRRKATRHNTDTITDRPTKTVEARNAGDKIDAKLSSRPTQRTDSASRPETDSVKLPDPALLSAKIVQNRQRPKCPGLFDVSVCPTHSSWRKTTMLRMAEQRVKIPQMIATDFECLKYFVVRSWTVEVSPGEPAPDAE